MEDEESVYNLIEKPVELVQKPPMYRSKYPSTIAPTASTFALKNTSKPGITNLSGNYNHPDKIGGDHKMIRSNATFGKVTSKQELMTATQSYLKTRSKYKALPDRTCLHIF